MTNRPFYFWLIKITLGIGVFAFLCAYAGVKFASADDFESYSVGTYVDNMTNWDCNNGNSSCATYHLGVVDTVASSGTKSISNYQTTNTTYGARRSFFLPSSFSFCKVSLPVATCLIPLVPIPPITCLAKDLAIFLFIPNLVFSQSNI